MLEAMRSATPLARCQLALGRTDAAEKAIEGIPVGLEAQPADAETLAAAVRAVAVGQRLLRRRCRRLEHLLEAAGHEATADD